MFVVGKGSGMGSPYPKVDTYALSLKTNVTSSKIHSKIYSYDKLLKEFKLHGQPLLMKRIRKFMI